MSMSNKDMILLARALEWQYQLDKYTEEQLGAVRRILRQAGRELFNKLDRADITDWSRQRTEQLLDEIQTAMGAVASKITGNIGLMTATSGSAAYDAHTAILGFNGQATAVKGVAVTANQLHSLVVTTPVGGRTLSGWVDRTFDHNMREKIRREIGAGIINGDGYRDVVKRLKESVPGTERQISTLAKTYVQSVNVQAMQDVYAANPDIVKSVLWRATFGLNTCILCASLDGTEYPVNGHPACPLHPLCRCVLIPVTVDAEKMGLTAKQLNEMARPYTMEKGVLKRGGKVIDSGTFKGNFEKWIKTASEKQQRSFFGAKRYEALQSGRLTFDQMVDKQTGRLRTLNELGLGLKKDTVGGTSVADRFQRDMDGIAKAIKKDAAIRDRKVDILKNEIFKSNEAGFGIFTKLGQHTTSRPSALPATGSGGAVRNGSQG